MVMVGPEAAGVSAGPPVMATGELLDAELAVDDCVLLHAVAIAPMSSNAPTSAPNLVMIPLPLAA
jgi:hypothetical protein